MAPTLPLLHRGALGALLFLAACATGTAVAPTGTGPPPPPPAAAAPLRTANPRSPSLPQPSAASLAAIDRLVAELTLEQQVAQLIVAYPPPGEGPVDLGGVILVGPWLRDPAALEARVARLQRRASLPLLVAVDLEGGALNRFKGLPTLAAFPSAKALGAEGQWEAEAWGRRAGLDLRARGVNVSLGPVLDLADHGFMAETGRSLGADAAQVARLGRAFARGLASARVLPIGKHYPGYGPEAGSSDKALLTVDRSPQEIARHQAAFVAAADDLAGVMLANVAFTAYGGVPAILSPALVARAHLSGFLTVTDDLAVASLLPAAGGDPAELWRRAFLAGNDLLLTTAPVAWPGQPDPRLILAELVRQRPELRQRLQESVRRVLIAKAQAGLLP